MLIVLEGPDGVGKSTIAQEIKAFLTGLGRDTEVLSFPGREPASFGELIYNYHHSNNKDIDPTCLQVAHVAAHIECINTRIKPALQLGHDVILDRYWLSTIVYGKLMGSEMEIIYKCIEAEKIAWQSTSPDLLALILPDHPWEDNLDVTAWKLLANEYLTIASVLEPSENLRVVSSSDHVLELILNLIAPSGHVV